MKKFVAFCYALVCVFVLSGCSDRITGDEGLVNKAREEISVSEAETVELIIAGNTTIDGSCLYWFVSGNQNQAHVYMPIEFMITGTDEYEFVKTYKPIERVADISALMWNDGYSFVINNENCCQISITTSSGSIEEITVESVPFVYYYDDIPDDYCFMDSDGNILE